MNISKFLRNLNHISHNYKYDLTVIGGGPGGLACANRASSYGKKVALIDFVSPTPHGTKWGIGGTCVNVGCIPKKIMRYISNYSSLSKDMKDLGWEHSDPKFCWGKMVNYVSDSVKSINTEYLQMLQMNNIDYFNGNGSFVDKNTIKVRKENSELELTSNYTLISTGCRPLYPNIPGAMEHGITSDDLFTLDKEPGKTLIIGASYVSLECAGFLNELGYDVSVMVRSILLRGFDREMTSLIESDLYSRGIRFMYNTTPKQLIKEEGNSQIKVVCNNNQSSYYDTVIFAVGRKPNHSSLNLPKGIEVNPNNNKIIAANGNLSTKLDNIYVCGDVLDKNYELTPVATHQGKYIADYLFGSFGRSYQSPYVPTCIYTPVEYASVGLNEDNNNRYLVFKNSYNLYGSNTKYGYSKILCDPSSRKIVGIHIFGPNASEIILGYTIAMNNGLTIDDLNNSVGIHPTHTENILNLVNHTSNSNRSGC